MKLVRHQRLGDFDIVAHLDKGGMAEVYLARNAGTAKLAVVKMLNEQWRKEEELVSMFKEEGQLMTRLHHPNVVTVLGHGEVHGLPYMILEYLAGDHLGTLGKVLRKESAKLSVSAIARIFLQVANGLANVHEATDEAGQRLSLVHRDISPENIFMCYDGQIKVLDFGIAQTNDRESYTHTGKLRGKIRYMSPEQIHNDALDRRSDIFSLGIVMWELSTGEKLFQDTSQYRIMKMICEEPIPSPQTLRPDLPDALSDIIMTCLQQERDKRYRHAGELRQALSDFLFAASDSAGGDELPRTIEALMSQRKQSKESFIESVYHQTRLQEYLFGELGDELPESASDQHEDVTSSEPALPTASVVRKPWFSRRRAWLSMAPLLLLAIAWCFVRLLPTERTPDPRPTLVATVSPVATVKLPVAEAFTLPELSWAETQTGKTDLSAQQAVVQTEDEQASPKFEPSMGILYFDSSPKVEVFIQGVFYGETPIVEMSLAPGRYELKLLNQEKGITRFFSLAIRPGEVTSHKVIY